MDFYKCPDCNELFEKVNYTYTFITWNSGMIDTNGDHEFYDSSDDYDQGDHPDKMLFICPECDSDIATSLEELEALLVDEEADEE